MDRRRVLRFFLLPALFGLAAAGLAYVYLQRVQPAAGAGRDEPRVPVVVAAQAIPARTRLTAEMLAVKQVPRQYAWRGSLQKVDQAAGKVTTAAIAAGEPVLSTALNLPENKVGLAFTMPEGFRAVTIPVNESSGVAGRLAVGDRVDVVAVLPKEVAAAEKSVLLLEDLAVLALGRDEADKAGGAKGEIRNYGTVTLAVKPDDGVLLALAQEKGRLQLMLRPAVKEGLKGRITVTEDVFK